MRVLNLGILMCMFIIDEVLQPAELCRSPCPLVLARVVLQGGHCHWRAAEDKKSVLLLCTSPRNKKKKKNEKKAKLNKCQEKDTVKLVA